jgi:hypothetical protein
MQNETTDGALPVRPGVQRRRTRLGAIGIAALVTLPVLAARLRIGIRRA